MQDFAGKAALITGGSLGIGEAVARRLAAGGAAVAFCGAEDAAVARTAQALLAVTPRVLGAVVDVSDSGQVSRFVGDAAAAFGGLDVVVTCAGIQRYGTVEDTGESLWDEVLDVNLKGVYLTCRFAMPELRRRGGGAIVTVSSVQAFAAQEGVAAYAASKAGIVGLSRAMAMDGAAFGIRVNTVCPGSVDTPMLRWAADKFRGPLSQDEQVASWGRSHPLGRVAEAAEVAELVAFLAGPRASFITGAEYRVDGGLLARNPAALPSPPSAPLPSPAPLPPLLRYLHLLRSPSCPFRHLRHSCNSRLPRRRLRRPQQPRGRPRARSLPGLVGWLWQPAGYRRLVATTIRPHALA